jgi:hypothetical protein
VAGNLAPVLARLGFGLAMTVLYNTVIKKSLVYWPEAADVRLDELQRAVVEHTERYVSRSAVLAAMVLHAGLTVDQIAEFLEKESPTLDVTVVKTPGPRRVGQSRSARARASAMESGGA